MDNEYESSIEETKVRYYKIRLKTILFLINVYAHVSVRGYVQVSAGAHGGRQPALHPLGLELQGGLNVLTRVLRPELGCSRRAGVGPNC